jgi:hypothetical protein
MNEITSVATNGSWVRMIVKIRAGSSGARRAQSPERRSADDGGPTLAWVLSSQYSLRLQ